MAGFVSGALNRVFWQLYDANSNTLGSAITLSQFRSAFAEEDQGHDVTSAGHNGQQAIISSILRGEGTASFHIKDEQYPSDGGFGVKAQAVGVIGVEMGRRRLHTIPVFISRVAYENETAAGTDYTVTFKLNSELTALSSGSVAYSYPS